jgi:gamma-glutamylcysteine synthetase
MKRINASVASGDFLPIREISKACMLDETILSSAVGDLDKPVKSMTFFFQALSSYLTELQKRVKMMSECYAAIQKLQMKHNVISVTADMPDPAIVWNE